MSPLNRQGPWAKMPTRFPGFGRVEKPSHIDVIAVPNKGADRLQAKCIGVGTKHGDLSLDSDHRFVLVEITLNATNPKVQKKKTQTWNLKRVEENPHLKKVFEQKNCTKDKSN